METAMQVLIIILAAVLAVFLIAAIWALVYVLKVLRVLKRVAQDTEKIVDSTETVTAALRNVSGPMALFKLISNLNKALKRQRRSK